MTDLGGQGPLILKVLWTETGIALVFVLLRLYTRKFVIRVVGWDDYFIVLALLLALLFAGCTTAATLYYGLGQHRAAVRPASAYATQQRLQLAGQVACILEVAAGKTAVACFVLRLVAKRWHAVLLLLCIASTWALCAFCVVVVATVFDCGGRGEAACWIDPTPVRLATSGWSVIMDFVLVILPIQVVWGLQMKRSEKTTVIVGLSLGLFAGVTGIIHIKAISSVPTGNPDSYYTWGILLSASTEGVTTIWSTSILVVRSLYVKVVRGRSRTTDPADPCRDDVPLSDFDGSHSQHSRNRRNNSSSRRGGRGNTRSNGSRVFGTADGADGGAGAGAGAGAHQGRAVQPAADAANNNSEESLMRFLAEAEEGRGASVPPARDVKQPQRAHVNWTGDDGTGTSDVKYMV